MKLPIQVEALVFQKTDQSSDIDVVASGIKVLSLHRVPAKGGFWQPLTGGVEDFDADHEAAIRREIDEELGVGADSIVSVQPLDYSFSFTGEEDRELTEVAYAVEVLPGTTVRLSDEHDDFTWSEPSEARSRYKWPENQLALDALLQNIGHQSGN